MSKVRVPAFSAEIRVRSGKIVPEVRSGEPSARTLPSAGVNPGGSRFWLAIAALIHAELALLIGFGLYALAPRDADLKRDLAARAANQPESIDLGMVDEDAAREIIADLDRQAEKKKGRGGQERGRVGRPRRTGGRRPGAARGEASRRRALRLRARHDRAEGDEEVRQIRPEGARGRRQRRRGAVDAAERGPAAHRSPPGDARAAAEPFEPAALAEPASQPSGPSRTASAMARRRRGRRRPTGWSRSWARCFARNLAAAGPPAARPR